MTPRTPRQATRLRFIGPADQFVAGVPQGELVIGDSDTETTVTLARARDLVATGLYESDGALPQAAPEEE